jgi:hypothetical protein
LREGFTDVILADAVRRTATLFDCEDSMLRSLAIAAVLGLAPLAFADVEKAAPDQAQPVDSRLTASHKQVTSIKPTQAGTSVQLNTYCLTADGDIVACVTPMTEGTGAAAYVQRYSPEGEMKSEFPVDFTATAVNVAANGEIYVAGAGRIARYSADGKVQLNKQTPNIDNLEDFKKKAAEDAKKQQEEYAQQMGQALKSTADQLAELEKTPEADRTPQQKAQITVLTGQKQQYELQCESMKNQAAQYFSVESVLASKLRVTSVALTDQDVFLCCGALNGRGYDVWRTDYNFENGTRVLKGLAGCCGQMDVQTAGDKVIVAENSRFRVGIYDRDGKAIHHFGSRDRNSEEGFGSCCNPMNVRCCSGGDILAAESSIGNLKRFSQDGKLVQLVGKAKIGAGCKHVAVAWDAKRDRYYMMNVDKGTICSLWPLSEAPAVTPDELAAKQAKEGLGKKLTGTWVRVGYTPKPPKPAANPLATLLGAIVGGGDSEDQMDGFSSNVPFDQVTFGADGTQKVTGGRLTAYGNGWKWECVRQDGQSLQVSELMEDMEYLGLQVDFTTDDEVKIGISYGDTSLPPAVYRRQTTPEVQTQPADKPVATDLSK